MKDNERQFKRNINYRSIAKTVGIIVLVGLVLAIMIYIQNNRTGEHAATLQVIKNYICITLVGAGVVVMIYAFSGVFTSKKGLRILLTAVLLVGAVFLYKGYKTPKVVKMKEDVLYVKPSSNN